MSVAIHEAGHVLMFDALGVPIAFATVEPDESLNLEGHVRLGCESHNVLHGLAGTMAGPAASFFVAGDSASDAHVKFASDQRVIRDMLQAEGSGESFSHVWARIQIFMHTWLRLWVLRYELQIRAFSRALLERRTLSGDDLYLALAAAWNGVRPDAAELNKELIAALSAQELVRDPNEDKALQEVQSR